MNARADPKRSRVFGFADSSQLSRVELKGQAGASMMMSEVPLHCCDVPGPSCPLPRPQPRAHAPW
eukprot:4606203-Prymnesium_polylepis.1